MRQWKEAGRADRAAEEELWGRFKAAQDTFFGARAKILSAKDTELREHADAKAALLAEAEELLPVTNARQARSALRGIQERWSRSAACPGTPRTGWKAACAGSRTRSAAARKRTGGGPTPRLCPAPAAPWSRSAGHHPAGEAAGPGQEQGNDKAAQQAEEALTARRSWLAEAERTLAELSS
jgi:hypothetical protein